MTRLNTLFVCALALLLCGCPPADAPGTSSSGSGLSGSAKKYPVEWLTRKYTEPAPEAAKAWELIEIGYWAVLEKFANATPENKLAVQGELKASIFNVNPTVEGLFKDAIKAQPDNPVNYSAYAQYLKPRRRVNGKTFVPTWNEALTQIDKAIELAPDEASYYITKIFIITAPHQAHEWMLQGAMEDLTIADKMPEVNKLFNQAEKYDPDNAFINYWHAQLLYRYTPPEELPKVWDQIQREIHAGNHKKENYFIFPAPLAPRQIVGQAPIITAEQTGAVYADQWLQFGSYSGQTIDMLVSERLKMLKWPQDKAAIADLMYMYYNLGRTEPYDRSFFSMQHVVLDKIRRDVDPKSDEGKKLAQAGRYLEEQYLTQANKLFKSNEITDSREIGSPGINRLETTRSRHNPLMPYLQGPQAAYLKKFGEIMGVEFPLPEDPEKW
jgi:hypothetical protein